MVLKVSKQQCRFAEHCIFLPLCLFVHSEDENDQARALAQNYGFDNPAMMVETVVESAESPKSSVLQQTPQNFPQLDFSTTFDGGDFLSEFDIYMDTQGRYPLNCVLNF